MQTHITDDQMNKQPFGELSIYIHWPWCKNKCPYCDFNSHVAAQIPEKDYIDALLVDLKKQAEWVEKRPVCSVFFGGGTPSLMSPKSLDIMLNSIGEYFSWGREPEISLEANPTSSSLKKFQDFKNAGINRLSIGIQSLDSENLSFLGREHTIDEALSTVDAALHTFKNVNTDFIYGLPQQNLKTWQKHLQQIIELGTPHLSAYQLTIEPHTAFHTQVSRNQWQPLTDEHQADFYRETRETISKANFAPYEVSNFAKENFECKHNLNVWKLNDYIGLGAGAHGRIHTLDRQHLATQHYKKPSTYIKTMLEERSAQNIPNKHFFVADSISHTRAMEEKLLMGIRLQEGVELPPQVYDDFYPQTMHSCTSTPFISTKAVKHMEQQNWLWRKNNILKIMGEGWLMLDSILEYILLPEHS